MFFLQLSKRIIILICILMFVSGCRKTQNEETPLPIPATTISENPTSTHTPPTATVTDIPPTILPATHEEILTEATPSKILPTMTPQLPAPTSTAMAEVTVGPPTPTPASVIGVPVVSEGWIITVDAAHLESHVSRGGLTQMPNGSIGFSSETHSAKSGFKFLIIDTTSHNLAPIIQPGVLLEHVTLMNENGKRYMADELSRPPGEFVFQIEENAVNQVFAFHFHDVPITSFSIGEEATFPLSTETNATSGVLPDVCTTEFLSSLSRSDHLTFARWEETGLVVGNITPDGSGLVQVCDRIAFGNIQVSPDGATLLEIFPKQGWPNLYLVEPHGVVYSLVENGLNIDARFDPSGRWVVFASDQVGKDDRELYSFDREEMSLTPVYTGVSVDFDFLSDGRLITDFKETEDSDRQYMVGSADGKTLTTTNLPDKVAKFAHLSSTGNKLIYRDVDLASSSLFLFVSDRDGGNEQQLAQSNGFTLDYASSPDDQFILMGIGDGEAGEKVELYHLETGESLTIVTNIDDAQFKFSTDSQWASIMTTVDSQNSLYIVHISDGRVQKIDNGINAFFSPDNTQLAYTLRQPDSSLEMYVISLENEGKQFLGDGLLTGWFPISSNTP